MREGKNGDYGDFLLAGSLRGVAGDADRERARLERLAEDARRDAGPDGRVGGWIQTYSGGQFWPADPRAEEIQIEDVAHALAFICRYTGHVVSFYSVAEHCARVSDVLAQRYPGERRLHLEGLLHDAPEFALTDINSPLKRDPLMRGYKMLEERMRLAFAERFALPLEEDHRVKEADLILLATEQRDVMAPCPHRWTLSQVPLDETIIPWDPRKAKWEFLKRFVRLMPDVFRCTECGGKTDAEGRGFVRGEIVEFWNKGISCDTCGAPRWVMY